MTDLIRTLSRWLDPPAETSRDIEDGSPRPLSAFAGPAAAALVAVATVLPTGMGTRSDGRCYFREDRPCHLWTVGGRTPDGRVRISRGRLAFVADPCELLDTPPPLDLSTLPQVATERVLLDPPRPRLTVVWLAGRPAGATNGKAHAALLDRLVRTYGLRLVYVDDPSAGGRPSTPSGTLEWRAAGAAGAFADRLRSQEGTVVAWLDRDLADELAKAGDVRLIRVEVRGDGRPGV